MAWNKSSKYFTNLRTESGLATYKTRSKTPMDFYIWKKEFMEEENSNTFGEHTKEWGHSLINVTNEVFNPKPL